MNYQLTVNGVLRLSDSAFIPQDSGNRDWLDYLDWVSSGGEPFPLESLLVRKEAEQSVFRFS
ncbi:hypothetical protein ACFS4T_07090 [Pseudomonas lini]